MNLDLTSKKFLKKLLKKEEIQPSKKMGQNFLISKNVLSKIVTTSELKPKDLVLEIGSGIGTLTKELTERAKKVIAVERDKRLVEILKEILKDFKNVEIVQKDVLEFQVSGSRFQDYKIVSNLPYSIATEVIKKFLEIENPPSIMVVMVQKEVGERICSRPPKMERLGVLIQSVADVKKIAIVKKDAFWPKPKVDSIILKIKPLIHADKKLINAEKYLFKRIVKAGFSSPRKQLINNLSRDLKLSREKVEKWLSKNNIQPIQRAQTLNLNDWLNLTKTFGDYC